MKGTSAGTVSNILNGKWENISEDMWRKVSDQVGTYIELVIVGILYQTVLVVVVECQRVGNLVGIEGKLPLDEVLEVLADIATMSENEFVTAAFNLTCKHILCVDNHLSITIYIFFTIFSCFIPNLVSKQFQ